MSSQRRPPTAANASAWRRARLRVLPFVSPARHALFASPLVLTALRSSLIMPLAGRDPAKHGSRLFLSLKASDSAKSGVFGVSFGQHSSRIDPLVAALMHSWIAPLIGEAAIVNGSGAFLGPSVNRANRGRIAIVPGNDTLWHRFRATPCRRALLVDGNATIAMPNVSSAERSHSSPATAAPGARCCRFGGYLQEGNNEARLIHQHLGLYWCGAAIERYETANAARARYPSSSWRFELIVFTRPDLVWWAPVPSWCEYPWGTSMLSCDRPGCDMAWAAPRMHLDRLLRQALLHRDCTEAGPPPHGAARMRNVRDAASCCATSEWLLWYAQSRYAGSGSGTGEIPVRRTAALEPDEGHFTLLRDSSHACARSLSLRGTPTEVLTRCSCSRSTG